MVSLGPFNHSQQERFPAAVLPFTASRHFQIVPGKAGNSSAGGFVNCTTTALFSKPPTSRLTGLARYQSSGTDKYSLAVIGKLGTERPSKTVLAVGGLVNSTVGRPSLLRSGLSHKVQQNAKVSYNFFDSMCISMGVVPNL